MYEYEDEAAEAALASPLLAQRREGDPEASRAEARYRALLASALRDLHRALDTGDRGAVIAADARVAHYSHRHLGAMSDLIRGEGTD